MRALRLALCPVAQLRQHRQFVGGGDTLVGGLQVRIAGAAEPDVAVRVVLLGPHTGIDLAGTHPGHVDLDAGLLLVCGRDSAAPFLIDATVHHELALCVCVADRSHGEHEGGGQTVK